MSGEGCEGGLTRGDLGLPDRRRHGGDEHWAGGDGVGADRLLTARVARVRHHDAIGRHVEVLRAPGGHRDIQVRHGPQILSGQTWATNTLRSDMGHKYSQVRHGT